MKNFRKIVCLVAMLILAVTLLPSAYADSVLTVSAENVTIDAGATEVDVKLLVTNNPGFSTAVVSVGYDSSVLETYIYDEDAYDEEEDAYFYTVPARAQRVFAASAIKTNVALADDLTLNPINFVISATSNSTANGTLAVLHFKVKDGAAAGTYPITVGTTTAGSAWKNASKQNVEYTLVNGSVVIPGSGPVEHTVTYNANGGSTTATTDTVEDGNAADLSPVATKEGFEHIGWNTDPDATTALSSYTVTGDVILYAIYEEIIPEAVLTGVITRGASSVNVNKAAGTIAVSYDTKQTLFPSSYVAFAPVVGDGVVVTYSDETGFFRKNAGITNYTETSNLTGTTVGIDLATEANTTKSAKPAVTILKSNPGVYNFTMTVDDGVNQEEYDVTLTVADSTAEASTPFITDGAVFKTFRPDDVVAIDTGKKEITLTTKTDYNYTTIAIKGSDFGPSEGRTRRVIEVLDAKDNSFGYVDFKGADGVDYDRAVLVNYGANRSYNIRIYGGEDGLSYEDYTLKVVYVASRDLTSIKLGNNRGLHNAKLNSAADCNDKGIIAVTYKTTGGMIRFSPVYVKGLKTAISGDEGLVDIVKETIAGAEREVYEIEDPTLVPSAMKYLVTYVRDTRTFDVNFIEG